MIKTITREEAQDNILNALEMITGLTKQLEVIYTDQTHRVRKMSNEEYHNELVSMLPALKGTAESCLYYVDSVFDYLNDSPDFEVTSDAVKEG